MCFSTYEAGSILLARLFLAPWPERQRRHRRARFQSWSRKIQRLAGMRLEVEGPVPDMPCLLVANHLTYLDIPVIATEFPGRFVAKADIRGWPFFGWLARSGGTIFINRASKLDIVRVRQEIETSLEVGEGVILFPEGTSTRGEDVEAFKSSLLGVAADLNLPVYSATLSYRTFEGGPPTDEVICWWDDAPFLNHALKLFRLPGFHGTLRFGELPIRDSDRKELALRLRAAVRERFEPVTGSPEVP